MQLHEDVIAGTTDPSASASSTSANSSASSTPAVSTQPGSTAPGATAPSIASNAQRKLTSTEWTPMNMVPRPAWVTQLCADLYVPLTASAGESTSVFNLDAMPPSPARPISSTISSEAGSPQRVLRSRTLTMTPSFKKSAASASSSVSQRAGRPGPTTLSQSLVKSSGASLSPVPEHEP